MTVLITGSCGHLGSYIVKKFLKSNHDVLGFDYPTSHTKKVAKHLNALARKKAASFEMAWGDISKKDDLEQAFSSRALDGVVHLAFILPPHSEMNPERARSVNVDGTKNLIELAEKHVKDKPFVFASSFAVHGPINPNDPPLTVERPLKPYNNYNSHKIECEKMIQQSSLNWRILRLSAVLNPKIMKINKEMLKYALAIPLTTKVQPVHPEDVATAMLHAFEREEASHRIFLIAGPEQSRVTYKEYIFRHLAAIFPDLSEDEIPWEKYGNNPYYLHWADTRESQEILDFQHHSFDDFIKEVESQVSFLMKMLLRISPIRKRAIMKMFPE